MAENEKAPHGAGLDEGEDYTAWRARQLRIATRLSLFSLAISAASFALAVAVAL